MSLVWAKSNIPKELQRATGQRFSIVARKCAEDFPGVAPDVLVNRRVWKAVSGIGKRLPTKLATRILPRQAQVIALK